MNIKRSSEEQPLLRNEYYVTYTSNGLFLYYDEFTETQITVLKPYLSNFGFTWDLGWE